MDARIARGLVVVGILVTAGIGYRVYTNLAGTLGALVEGKDREGAVAKASSKAEPKAGDPAEGPPDEARREVRDPREPRPRPDAVLGGPVAPVAREGGAAPVNGWGASVAEEAARRGLTPHELREQRAERQGITFEELRARREGRSDWRSDQNPDDLVARHEARVKQHAELSPDELQRLEEARQARRDLLEQDPTLGDAAKVLKQLKELGEANQPPP